MIGAATSAARALDVGTIVVVAAAAPASSNERRLISEGELFKCGLRVGVCIVDANHIQALYESDAG